MWKNGFSESESAAVAPCPFLPKILVGLVDKPSRCYRFRPKPDRERTRVLFRLRNGVSGPEMRLPAEFRPDSSWEILKIGLPAVRLMFPRLESGRHPARKTDFRPGSTTA